MTQSYQNYDRTIYADTEESLSKIVSKIPDYSIVLDVGCSTGMLGRYLSEKKGCIVDGVDFDGDAVEICRPKYRFTAVKNLESDPLTDVFRAEAYDYIVIADVIEHLVNPDKLLSELKKLVKPRGTVIFSVPNITHIASSLELLLGNFDYRKNGLLDSTHLRFYSYSNLVSKLSDAGLYAWETDVVRKNIDETEFGSDSSKLFPKQWLDALISARPDSLVYQWIVSTKIYPRLDQIESHPAIKGITSTPVFTTALYWEKGAGSGFNEINKLVGFKAHEADNELTIDFNFQFFRGREYTGYESILFLKKKFVWIKSAKIVSDQNIVIWEWPGVGRESELVNAKWIDAKINIGKLLSPDNDDPQWYPDIPAEIMQKITSGTRFSAVMCDSENVVNLLLADTLFTANQAVSDRDNQIASLNQAVAERDNQITSLNQAVAERDNQIASLNQAVAERDNQIASLNQGVYDGRRELAHVLASKSWQLTKPFRFARRVAVSRPHQAARRMISDNSRRLWQGLPVSFEHKRKLKDFLFRTFPLAFRWSKAYQAWANFNSPVYYSAAGKRPNQQAGVADNVYVPLLDAKPLEAKPAKLICFYLPQFHPIPENNAWWGEGFTEWTNVQPAQPQFAGHYQPHVPGELGYYNLLDPAVQRRQVELAKLYGIGGFCFYFYWFGGKHLLEAPIENYLNDSSLDLPFCLCWANENWSRRWDGLDSEILIAQQHSAEDDLAFIEHVARYMRDSRYIRIDGKPLLLVYRPSLLPSAKKTASRWRDWCRANGIGDIYLAYTQSFEIVDPAKYGFDAAIEFPPNNSAPPNITNTVSPLGEDFGCTVYDWTVFVERSEHYKKPDYTLLRSVCPSWDNTARRKSRGTVFLNNTPALYKRWLENVISDTVAHRANPDERLIFVNAWNEWAEGAHLEPDTHYGYAWLQATRNALSGQTYIPNSQRKIILVVHDAHPHGAQMLALNLAKTLSQGMGFYVDLVCLGDGPLIGEYAKWATVHLLSGKHPHGFEAVELAKNLFASGHRTALVNSTVSGLFLETLVGQGIECVALIHELKGVLSQNKLHGHARAIATSASKVVFPSVEVAESFNDVAPIPPDKLVIRPQGLYKRMDKSMSRESVRARLRQKLGLEDDAQIILAAGYADHRKGIDLFVAAGLAAAQNLPKARWVWIGHWEQTMQHAVEKQLARFPDLRDRFIFPGLQADTDLFYGGADVYALTSREDPFPSVVLEALDAGVPVVGFDGAGGFIGLLNEGCGKLVPKENAEAFALAVTNLLEKSEEKDALGLRGAALINERFSFRRYVFDLLDLLGMNLARVSAIVPNYNYAQYLPERLGSIIKQDYPIYEIIFLDDCSKDESIQVAEKMLRESGIDCRIIINEENSGSVFRQWKKGADLASGTHVWLAEADDSCSHGLVSELLKGFRTPGVVLSYCESQQINETGASLANNYLAYVSDVDANHWLTPFVMDGNCEIANSLSIKNTIPNVSAVLFKKDVLTNVLKNQFDLISSYRIAGDWLTYVLVLDGGRVAFSPMPLNKHRRHNSGMTISNINQSQLDEICRMQKYIAEHHSVPAEKLEQAKSYIESLQEEHGIAVHSAG